MGGFDVIKAVSTTLCKLLEDHFKNETELANVLVDLQSPKELGIDEKRPHLSLWLYRVNRNEHMLNQPPKRPAPNQIVGYPLPLNLYYLVTPLAKRPHDEQAILGGAIQVFHDHAILRSGDVPNLPGELRLTLEALSLEEITRIWTALQLSYELSVSYVVQLVTIDSDHEPVQVSPVVVKETTYTQILPRG